jgi:acyl-CoA thioesterase-1
LEGIIAAVGNSLTEGYGVEEEETYPVLLERKLRENGYGFTVINAGISGETSSGTRSRIQWILTLKPDIVILETGANDGLRGIDPKVTGQNLDEIVRIFKEKGVIVVLAGMRMVQNLGEEYTQAFREIYPACAQKHGTIFIPFFLEGVAGNQGVNQRDGIHPTAEGYKRVVQTIYPHIKEAVELWRKQKTGPAEITGKEPIGGNK